MSAATVVLVVTTCIAALINGALGYGFSSITVPVALLFFSNRILNPALVIVEVFLNICALIVNRKSIRLAWARVSILVVGLLPGAIIGSYLVVSISTHWMKLGTYAVLLPLILIQASAARKPIKTEKAVGVPVGAALGILYSTTTISGPPLALFLSNQGLAQDEFRASLAIVRMIESSLTAFVYFYLGLFTRNSFNLIYLLIPGVIAGMPVGAYFVRHVNRRVFSRICRTFDVWIVGFGMSRALVDVGIVERMITYGPLVVAILFDAYFLRAFLRERNVSPQTGASAVSLER